MLASNVNLSLIATVLLESEQTLNPNVKILLGFGVNLMINVSDGEKETERHNEFLPDAKLFTSGDFICHRIIVESQKLIITRHRLPQELFSKMLRKYAALAKNSGYVVKNLKGDVASGRIPGPTTDDLNRTGNIGIWRVIRWCEMLHITAQHTHDPQTGSVFKDLDKLYANQVTFLISVKCSVGEDLYKLVDATEPTPLAVNIGLCNIGNTSMGYRHSAVDETGRELAQVVMQIVFVDEKSRKPVPMPDWWKQKHGSPTGEERQKVVKFALSVSAAGNTYKHTIKVSWTDIDENHHVNYISYIMFCFDAAMHAVQKNFYIGFFDDIFKYSVKTLQIRYINECRAGDVLTVVTWQDAENPRIINFSIEQEGNILVQCSMEFFLRAHL